MQAVYLLALLWGLALVHIDLRVRRLPDRLVLPAYGVTAVALLVCSAVTGRWSALAVGAAAAGVAVAVFLLLALLSPGAGGLGLGDVKLAGCWPPCSAGGTGALRPSGWPPGSSSARSQRRSC